MLAGHWEYSSRLLLSNAGPLGCNKTKLLWDFAIAGNPSDYKFTIPWCCLLEGLLEEFRLGSENLCPSTPRHAAHWGDLLQLSGTPQYIYKQCQICYCKMTNMISLTQEQGLKLHEQWKEKAGKCTELKQPTPQLKTCEFTSVSTDHTPNTHSCISLFWF